MEGYKTNIEKPMVLYIKTKQCETGAFTITFKRKKHLEESYLYNEN